MEAFPYISKRFALQRFLGLTEEELAENERLWEEEQESEVEDQVKGSDLRSIGISSGDLDTDLETAEGMDAEGEMPPPEVAPGAAGPQAMPGGGVPAQAAPVM